MVPAPSKETRGVFADTLPISDQPSPTDEPLRIPFSRSYLETLAADLAARNRFENPTVLPTGNLAFIRPVHGMEELLLFQVATGEVRCVDRWTYPRPLGAAALAEWNGSGEPAGWSFHPASGRSGPEPAQQNEPSHAID